MHDHLDLRRQFLRDKWRPYPPMPDGAIDVADLHLEKGLAAMVCGRLHRSAPDSWWMSSNGREFAVDLHSSLIETCEPAEILIEGDIIALSVTVSHDLKLIADKWILLVPNTGAPPKQNKFNIENSRQWSRFLQSVRLFFGNRDFIELQTPTLVASPGTEAHLLPFATQWSMGSDQETLFLPTSPEFHLKKMLARGWSRIFECKVCFRNGEVSQHHQPEFNMLEWYRAYARLDAIEADVQNLLFFLGNELQTPHTPHTREELRVERKSMSELFADAFYGFKLKSDTSREELLQLALRNGVRTDASDSWDEIFFRLFLEKIEPQLGMSRPLIVYGYPPSQAALARIGEDGFAERFELYWHGLEIANAFHELNDPIENELRFKRDAAQKARLGLPPVPGDQDLLRWIHFGLPPTGGIALGLDRLFMAYFNIKTITDARAFPR